MAIGPGWLQGALRRCGRLTQAVQRKQPPSHRKSTAIANLIFLGILEDGRPVPLGDEQTRRRRHRGAEEELGGALEASLR